MASILFRTDIALATLVVIVFAIGAAIAPATMVPKDAQQTAVQR